MYLQMNKTWKAQNLDYLETFFGELAEAWKDEKDDRRVFSNSYFHIVEAIKTLDDNPHVYVRCAKNHMMNEEIEQLERIKERFTGK